jgi:pimeloyl-ACP methyl ester carboxylesterase
LTRARLRATIGSAARRGEPLRTEEDHAMRRLAALASHLLVAFAIGLSIAPSAHADGTVGTTFPRHFPVIRDASLGTPLLGFGAAGEVTRTPVIFVHGNNDTPYPTSCNPFGKVQAFAQYFADHGYALSELWALGYQGDQCDLAANETLRSGIAHTTAANVPDLRRFVKAVLAYTHARQVDLVGHSLGVVIVREWLRQDEGAEHLVRRFVAVDGANHGIINCSPSSLNYWQAPSLGGFTPTSAICVELGSPRTPFLKRLNRGREGLEDDDDTLVIRNADTSFVYFPSQDGFLAGVPAIDSFGNPTDFSGSARLRGAHELDLTGQGIYDDVLKSSHLGILNSPDTWKATLEFLRRHHRHDDH